MATLRGKLAGIADRMLSLFQFKIGEGEIDAAEIDRDLIAERFKTDAVSDYLILRNE